MRTTLLAAVAATVTLLAACGDDEPDAVPATTAAPVAPSDAGATASSAPEVADSDPGTTAATDTTTAGTADAGTATAPGSAPSDGEAPRAIVSLSPVHTEILFAIGAGDQVIAVDDQSDYPPEALEVGTDLSGFEPNIEAIASYEPDLVVASSDTVRDQLEALGIEVWVGPAAATLDDAYDQIEQLGALTGHIGEAAEVVGGMQTDIAAIVEDMPALDEPLTVYHELGPELYSADSTTFIGQVYGQLGLENIADRAEGDHGGYPQLSAEVIISADPDLIFLADTECCGESAETVADRDGWDEIAAVADGQVFEMSDDIASRWGPRIVEYYQQVADAVSDVAGVPAGG
ncbi:MAG: ABC transporter substrate-binding protein [Desertimonas sp.]